MKERIECNPQHSSQHDEDALGEIHNSCGIKDRVKTKGD